jgi:hypothetical protein
VYRFTVLFFNCLLTFGTYFCFDMPSVLQTHFTCVSFSYLVKFPLNIDSMFEAFKAFWAIPNVLGNHSLHLKIYVYNVYFYNHEHHRSEFLHSKGPSVRKQLEEWFCECPTWALKRSIFDNRITSHLNKEFLIYDACIYRRGISLSCCINVLWTFEILSMWHMYKLLCWLIIFHCCYFL